MEIKQIINNTSNRTTRLIEANYITSNRSNRVASEGSTKFTENKQIEIILQQNSDIIDASWEARHAKYCYRFGVHAYITLLDKARKYGNNPKHLLAHMISIDLQKSALQN